LKGHEERVNCALWFHDELLISASDDGTIRVWTTIEKINQLGLKNI